VIRFGTPELLLIVACTIGIVCLRPLFKIVHRIWQKKKESKKQSLLNKKQSDQF